MKKDKPNEHGSKTIMLLFVILTIIIIIAIFLILRNNTNKDYKEVIIEDEKYYQRLTENTWKGQYHQENFYVHYDQDYNIDEMEDIRVVSYTEYLDIIDSINLLIENKIKPYYTDENSNYIILSYIMDGLGTCEMELIDCLELDNKIILYGQEKVSGIVGNNAYIVTIPTNMPVGTEIEYRECYTESEIDDLRNPGGTDDPAVAYKPIIYLYPTKDTEVSVELQYKDNITVSYPKYINGWKVLARKNGILTDLITNKNLYSLYYESKNAKDFKIENDGFIVKGEDAAEFLEEKLSALGLTEREAEEFIIYWLPKLEKNKYNYIRFANEEEINENMPLKINPNPDTVIRVLMTFKALEKPINVERQQLEAPNRTGFVAVEWGGTEIK